jgi:hypothetical protein
MLPLAQAELSSYLYRLCITYTNLSVLGTTQYSPHSSPRVLGRSSKLRKAATTAEFPPSVLRYFPR